MWYGPVLKTLRDSGLFVEVSLVGAKVRASLSETSFLDIHFDPTTGSYSYALIDLTTPYPGDKRVLGYLLNNLGRTCLALPKSARHVMAMPLSIERIRFGLG